MGGIRDWRDAEFDRFIRQHDDEFRTAPQIEMREQMADVFSYRNVFKTHSQRNRLGRKPAHQPRQRFELSRLVSRDRVRSELQLHSR
jgi:hypothetical protein